MSHPISTHSEVALFVRAKFDPTTSERRLKAAQLLKVESVPPRSGDTPSLNLAPVSTPKAHFEDFSDDFPTAQYHRLESATESYSPDTLNSLMRVSLHKPATLKSLPRSGWPQHEALPDPVAENLRDAPTLPAQRRTVARLILWAAFAGFASTASAVVLVSLLDREQPMAEEPPPTHPESQRLAADWGITSRVHFRGQMSEAEALDYYCGCDILVFPTFHAEGFPMSIFQAVAAGMAVVTTRIRAAADYLEETEHALFVPAHDPEAIAHGLQRLLTEPSLLAAMRQANRRLSRRFDRQRVAADFAAIYKELHRDSL
jgi:hypothetical protein